MATADAETRVVQLDDVNAIPPTNFGAFVTQVLARQLRTSENKEKTTAAASSPQKIDQKVLRQCIDLSSSFLITDTATNPERGISTWYTGLSGLVDLVIVLHKRHELELETVNSASRACSECWTIAGNWRGFDDCRNCVREIGGKLKKILDANEKTYQGERVYAP